MNGFTTHVLPFVHTSPSTVKHLPNAAYASPKQCTTYASGADENIGAMRLGQLVRVCGTPDTRAIKATNTSHATGTCEAETVEACRQQCNASPDCKAFTFDHTTCDLLTEVPSPLLNVGTQNNDSSVYECSTMPAMAGGGGMRQLASSTCTAPRTGVGCADDACAMVGSASCTDAGTCAPPFAMYDAPTKLSPNVYAATPHADPTSCQQKWREAYAIALGKDTMEKIMAGEDGSDAANTEANTKAKELRQMLDANLATLCAT